MPRFDPIVGDAPPRDYGTISSSSSANLLTNTTTVPEVSFSSYSPSEFNTLCQLIAQNIQTIDYYCKELEKTYKLWKTRRIKQVTSSQIETEAIVRIQSMTTDFHRLAVILRFGDKQQKLQLEKLANDFHSVLEKYSSLQKLIATTLRQANIESLQLESENESLEVVKDGNILPGTVQDTYQRENEMNELNVELLLKRSKQIEHIENVIFDISSIMRDLHKNVEMQGENVGMLKQTILTYL